MAQQNEDFLITDAERESINSSTAEPTGGEKGSLRVKLADKLYAQQKTTPTSAPFYKFKAKLQEHRGENSAVELWSEYISSIVSYDTTKDLKLNPKVKLAYKDQKAHLYSIYLGHQEGYTGDAKVQTLDDWGKPKKGIGNDTSRHIHFSADGSSKKPNALDISGEENELLRQDLCDHLAMAASMGDHDVNPGNMMVIKDANGNDRLGHIDPGHAYNNQINAAKIFRGGVFNKDNHILDFFNRPSLTAQTPKLWRDYSGFCPSKELAKSLTKVSAIDGSEKYDTAKAGMLAYIESVPVGEQQKEKDEMRKSLVALSNRPGMNGDGMEKIEALDTFEEVMNKTFNNLKAFDIHRKKEMGAVGKLMDLQCDIEEFAKNAPSKNTNEYKKYKKSEVAQTLQKRFNEILDDKTNNPGIVSGNKIQWIKTDAQSKPFKGNLNGFLEHRVQKIQSSKTESLTNIESKDQGLPKVAKSSPTQNHHIANPHASDSHVQGPNKESFLSKAKTFAKNAAKALGGSIGTLSFGTAAFYLIAASIVGIATGGVAVPIIGAIAASACGYGAIKSAKIAKEGFTGKKSSPSHSPQPAQFNPHQQKATQTQNKSGNVTSTKDQSTQTEASLIRKQFKERQSNPPVSVPKTPSHSAESSSRG
jgi:hypothetical protein